MTDIKFDKFDTLVIYYWQTCLTSYVFRWSPNNNLHLVGLVLVVVEIGWNVGFILKHELWVLKHSVHSYWPVSPFYQLEKFMGLCLFFKNWSRVINPLPVIYCIQLYIHSHTQEITSFTKLSDLICDLSPIWDFGYVLILFSSYMKGLPEYILLTIWFYPEIFHRCQDNKYCNMRVPRGSRVYCN